MESTAGDRRRNRRYAVRLPLHYRCSLRGELPRTGSGMTIDMSTNGISFRSRRPLPIGAHIEIEVDWPARAREAYPVDLQVTGFVVRSDSGRTAARMTSRKFRVASQAVEPIRQSA
ncbi:MAG TPA: PilZ domain-containing protein [Candidatus Sulfopaludibacter sp.]|nr:PilZ domain-containing protein [Candidatus Sulfopaludibacter sp.]